MFPKTVANHWRVHVATPFETLFVTTVPGLQIEIQTLIATRMQPGATATHMRTKAVGVGSIFCWHDIACVVAVRTYV